VVVRELRRLSAQLVEVMFVPVEKRIRRRLLELADLFGDEDTLTIPLTQEGLAQLTDSGRQCRASGLAAGAHRAIDLIEVEQADRLHLWADEHVGEGEVSGRPTPASTTRCPVPRAPDAALGRPSRRASSPMTEPGPRSRTTISSSPSLATSSSRPDRTM